MPIIDLCTSVLKSDGLSPHSICSACDSFSIFLYFIDEKGEEKRQLASSCFRNDAISIGRNRSSFEMLATDGYEIYMKYI